MELILVGLDGDFWIFFPKNSIKFFRAFILDTCLICLPWIGNHQFLNSLLYLYHGTTQNLSSWNRVKELILASASATDKATIELF